MRSFLSAILLLFLVQFAEAHVGSAGVQMQGQAGPYTILVSAQPPEVIPGTANVTVFIENGKATRVLARPIYFRNGDKGAPDPEALQKVEGSTEQFGGIVWLMTPGSSSIQIEIEGSLGKGMMIVPVAAVSTAQKTMPPQLGIGLGIVGLLLFVLIITTIGASVSDGLLKQGEKLTAEAKKKRWINMGIASAICILILYGGSSWWDSWAANYRQHLYKPLTGTTTILSDGTNRKFQIKIDTVQWNENRRGSMLSTLIPDDGKLMHSFLIRIPELDAFAHIHPERKDSTTFEAKLPQLPAGQYVVYSDILRCSGFPETITDTLTIPEFHKNVQTVETAEDDNYITTEPINAGIKGLPADNVVICGKPGTKTVFKDKSYAIWEGKSDKPMVAGQAYQLAFEIFNPDGSICLPEPYLGMLGHVALVKSDGSVYIHLHPNGTTPMAAAQSFKKRLADTSNIYRIENPIAFRDSVDTYLSKLNALHVLDREQQLMTEMGMYDAKPDGKMAMEHGNRLTFPYAFPKAGKYRIFLQIKRNGVVQSGAFDVNVKDPEAL